MPRKTNKPIVEPYGLQRPQGKFEPVPDSQEITLAQVSRPELIAENLALIARYCELAEMWLTPGERDPGCCDVNQEAVRPNAGIAKSFLRDAVVKLAEIWLGKPGAEALELIRRLAKTASRNIRTKKR